MYIDTYISALQGVEMLTLGAIYTHMNRIITFHPSI
jgi:hypothetical protein